MPTDNAFKKQSVATREPTNINGPIVSVCIPVRNGARYIGLAIASVLDQSYRNFEVVIVDNCSTDNTASLIRELALSESRIRFYKNDRDLGLVGNLNTCLQHARGDYIKFVMADDMLMPDCLDTMISAFEGQPSAVMVVAGRQIVDESGNRMALRRYSAKRSTVPGYKVIQRCLFRGNYIGEPTAVMFRRCDAIRGFRDDLIQLTDLEMWFCLLERGELVSLPETLCAIRHHGGQMTVQSIKSGALIDDNVRLFEEYAKKQYIQSNWTNNFTRRVHMAYRIWVSRKYLGPLRRKEVLRRHSILLVYYLIMPIVGGLLVCFRKARHLLQTL